MNREKIGRPNTVEASGVDRIDDEIFDPKNRLSELRLFRFEVGLARRIALLALRGPANGGFLGYKGYWQAGEAACFDRIGQFFLESVRHQNPNDRQE